MNFLFFYLWVGAFWGTFVIWGTFREQEEFEDVIEFFLETGIFLIWVVLGLTWPLSVACLFLPDDLFDDFL
jgi:hypothetical protein